jgi:hypothetical protein
MKFLLPLHSAMILRTIEVKSLGLMVSSSMDRYPSLSSTPSLSCLSFLFPCSLSSLTLSFRILCSRTLIVWPSSLLLKYDTPDFEEFRHEFESIPLTGQIHAIRSLAYAPHNELILGAGFDYDVCYFSSSTPAPVDFPELRCMLGTQPRKLCK